MRARSKKWPARAFLDAKGGSPMASRESRRSFSEVVREPHSRLRAGLAILLVAIAVAALLLLFRGQDGKPVDEPDGTRIAEQAGAPAAHRRPRGDAEDL